MWARVCRHRLVGCDANFYGVRVGFVNVDWDGGVHALVQGTIVGPGAAAGLGTGMGSMVDALKAGSSGSASILKINCAAFPTAVLSNQQMRFNKESSEWITSNLQSSESGAAS